MMTFSDTVATCASCHTEQTFIVVQSKDFPNLSSVSPLIVLTFEFGNGISSVIPDKPIQYVID